MEKEMPLILWLSQAALALAGNPVSVFIWVFLVWKITAH